MFTASFASVALIVILLYVFRRNLKTVNETAPEIIDHGLKAMAAASEYAEDLTLVNISEANVELAQRAKAVEDALNNCPAINIRDLHRRTRGITTA